MAALSTNPYMDAHFNNAPLTRPGVPPNPVHRSNSLDVVPLKRITGVKVDQIYNPRLPSLRRIEMDHLLGKLPYEHCRNTTWLSKREFDQPTVKIFEDRQFNKQVFKGSSTDHAATGVGVPSGDALYGTTMAQRVPSATAMTRAQVARREMEEMAKSQDRFSKYLATNLNAAENNALPPIKYSQTLREEPSIDWKGQVPVPVRSLDKHRFLPNQHLSVANSAWK
ncbi:uncharacterized protein LOC142352270 [Convolutriloba macropyga]|uniref:uncharacterized protein LOC142352270 n=1 Tax=Convolutriloba macropyga TaxID=536237 RepID=UPI003F526FDA